MLIEVLKSPDAVEHVARILGDMGPEAREAVPALAAKLDRFDDQRKIDIAAAILRIDPAHEEASKCLFEALGKRGHGRSHKASEALGRSGKPALDDLIRLLKSDDLETVKGALRALEAMGAIAAEAIPDIDRWVASEDEKMAQLAIRVKIAIEGLRIDIPEGTDPDIAESVVELLDLYRRDRLLTHPWNDTDIFFKRGINEYILLIGKPAVPILVNALRHPDVDTRAPAARCLIFIEEKCAAMPILENMKREKNDEVFMHLGWVLLALEDPEVIEPLEELARTVDGKKKEHTTKIIELLRERLTSGGEEKPGEKEKAHSDEEGRASVEELGQELIRKAKEGDVFTNERPDAARKLADRGKEALLTLHGLAQHPNPRVRKWAVIALIALEDPSSRGIIRKTLLEDARSIPPEQYRYLNTNSRYFEGGLTEVTELRASAATGSGPGFWTPCRPSKVP
jgi:HEAT repeat protein